MQTTFTIADEESKLPFAKHVIGTGNFHANDIDSFCMQHAERVYNEKMLDIP